MAGQYQLSKRKNSAREGRVRTVKRVPGSLTLPRNRGPPPPPPQATPPSLGTESLADVHDSSLYAPDLTARYVYYNTSTAVNACGDQLQH